VVFVRQAGARSRQKASQSCVTVRGARSAGTGSVCATAGRRNIDGERYHQSNDRPESPLSAEQADHHRIPEKRGREKDEAEDEPEGSADDFVEPGRQQPQEENYQPWRDQSEQGD
jgi:hypothetical protein